MIPSHTPLMPRVVFVLIIAMSFAAAVGAQTPPVGRIEGVITDSVHARPLSGVMVMLSRVTLDPQRFVAATSDAKGRYHFDSLAAGRYAITFSSDVLDSLDIVLPDRKATVMPGQSVQVDLAIPSGATLRMAACPGLHLAEGTGAVVGSVVDAKTDQPLADARVVVAWTDLTVDRRTKRPVVQQRTGSALSDSLGLYRLCGVPTGTGLAVQVQHAGIAGALVDMVVDDSIGVIRRNFSFSLDGARVTVVTATGGSATIVSAAPLTGTATLSGAVRDAGGRPLADVQLRIVDVALSARTDSLGAFTMAGLPAGTQRLEARRIGYVMWSGPVDLRNGRTLRQDVQLVRVVSLDSVHIVARRSLYRDFERHRNGGFGTYFDEGEIERRQPFQTSDMIRMLPGFRVVSDGMNVRIESSRGAVSLSRKRSCEVNVVIDRMQHMEINSVHPADIGAIEAYRGSAGAPPEYDAPCGVIVIWTKH